MGQTEKAPKTSGFAVLKPESMRTSWEYPKSVVKQTLAVVSVSVED